MSVQLTYLNTIDQNLCRIKELLELTAQRLETGWLPGKKVEYRYESWDSILLKTTLKKETGTFLSFMSVRDESEQFNLYAMIQASQGNVVQVKPGFVRFLEADELESQIKTLEGQVEELKALLYPQIL